MTATALPRRNDDAGRNDGGYPCCDVPVTPADLSAGLSAIAAWCTRAVRAVTSRR